MNDQHKKIANLILASKIGFIADQDPDVRSGIRVLTKEWRPKIKAGQKMSVNSETYGSIIVGIKDYFNENSEEIVNKVIDKLIGKEINNVVTLFEIEAEVANRIDQAVSSRLKELNKATKKKAKK